MASVATWYPLFGVMLNVWLAPLFTIALGVGLIAPLVPAYELMVNVFIAKVALMVWFAATAANVYVARGPKERPSTRTSAIWYPAFAAMLNTLFAP